MAFKKFKSDLEFYHHMGCAGISIPFSRLPERYKEESRKKNKSQRISSNKIKHQGKNK